MPALDTPRPERHKRPSMFGRDGYGAPQKALFPMHTALTVRRASTPQHIEALNHTHTPETGDLHVGVIVSTATQNRA